jgi:hypothetical protein
MQSFDYNAVLVPLAYDVIDGPEDERLDDMVTHWRPRIPVPGERVKLVASDCTSVNYVVTGVIHETWYPNPPSDPYPVNRVLLSLLGEDND